ncbi:MAG: YkgJ family cysteine cluster protein [Candidatus Thorarchaeota archaeon]
MKLITEVTQSLNSFHCNHDGSCDRVRQCCIDTEMTLTRKDAERIDALGYSREDYMVRSNDGFCELRNINGNCYFYDDDSKACRIYEDRPDGCRFYPIIYDFKKRKCVVDKDCPSRDTMGREEIRKSCKKVRHLVETLVREAAHNENPC